MAAYAATVALDQRTAIQMANNAFKLLSGSVAITNYNSTLAEITGITKMFAGDAPRVICDGVTSNGYLAIWVAASKALKCFYPKKAITPAGTAGNAVTNNAGVLESSGGQDLAVNAQAFTGTAVPAQAGTEVANDVNIGTVNFLAFGV